MRPGLMMVLLLLFLWGPPTANSQTTQPDRDPPATGRPRPQPPVLGGQPRDAQAEAGAQLAARIAAAHRRDRWLQFTAVQVHLKITWDERTIMDGTLLYDIHTSRARIDTETETGTHVTLVCDGEHVWISPADAEIDNARFHLRAWPYLLAAPFKLDDPGTQVRTVGIQRLQGAPLDTLQLSFEPGTGDTPDDWYLLHADVATSALRAITCHATTALHDASPIPQRHVVLFENFGMFNSILLARRWRFWNWDDEATDLGELIGTAELGELRFIDPPAADAFTRPADSREVPPPKPQPQPQPRDPVLDVGDGDDNNRTHDHRDDG